MSKATIHVDSTDFEYAHSITDIIENILVDVNFTLKEQGIDFEFALFEHCDGEMPPQYYDNEHPDYTGNIVIEK